MLDSTSISPLNLLALTQNDHVLFTETLKTELEHKLAMEMEQTQRGHQMQMQAARMELDRAIELTKHKVRILFCELKYCIPLLCYPFWETI